MFYSFCRNIYKDMSKMVAVCVYVIGQGVVGNEALCTYRMWKKEVT